MKSLPIALLLIGTISGLAIGYFVRPTVSNGATVQVLQPQGACEEHDRRISELESDLAKSRLAIDELTDHRVSVTPSSTVASEPTRVRQVESYPDGTKKEEGDVEGGHRDGLWTTWHANGAKSSEGAYKAGVRTGRWKGWYENGQLEWTGDYVEGLRDGNWTFCDSKGVMQDFIYRKGQPVSKDE